jgi:hypothetical protein
VFVIRFASIGLSASARRRDTASGSHDLNELDMTEPQPSRSVKRPTQSLSKRARDSSGLAANPAGLGLAGKKRGPVRELHQFLIRPTTYATSSPVGRLSAGIGGADRKFWGKLVFAGKSAWNSFWSHNPVTWKESFKINKLGQVLEKVWRLFRDLL